MLNGQVTSVNVGLPRAVLWQGRTVITGIWKEPIADRRCVSSTNIDGDRQADLTVHGGPDKAVYVYAAENLWWWENVLGTPVPPGTFGENLTVATSWPLGDSLVGEQWRIGTALFEVAQPRLPCYKLGIRVNDPGFVRRFAKARRWGLYLRVLAPGEIGRGDGVSVVHRPGHAVTVDLVGRAFIEDRALAPQLLAAPALPADWVNWVAKQAAVRAARVSDHRESA